MVMARRIAGGRDVEVVMRWLMEIWYEMRMKPRSPEGEEGVGWSVP